MPARLKISGDAFDLWWNGTPADDRRALDDGVVAFLHETIERYHRLIAGRLDPAGLLALGRELFRWVDGDRRQLARLFEQATPPLVFEVERVRRGRRQRRGRCCEPPGRSWRTNAGSGRRMHCSGSVRCAAWGRHGR